MKHPEYRGKCALVRYKGGAVGGDLVEDCTGGAPVEVLLGAGQVPPGVDEVLYDMEIGETRHAIIPCEKAYGPHDPDGVQAYPRTFLKGGSDLREGDIIPWTHPVSGRDVPVRVVRATSSAVVIDFNHLLAGHDLDYWFELVDVVGPDGASLGTGRPISG